MDKRQIDRKMLSSALQAGTDCLSASALEKLAAGSAPDHSHVNQCARCNAELSMLRAFQSTDPLPDEGAAVAWISSQMGQRLGQITTGKRVQERENGDHKVSGWMGRWFAPRGIRWLMTAGAVAVIAAVSVLWLRSSKEPDLRADASSGIAVYRSLEVQLVTPTYLPQMPTTLQWKPVEGAFQYKISIMEIDKVPLFETTTNDIFVTTPVNAINKLRSGRPLLWQVAALDRQGYVMAISQIARLSMRQDQSN